MSRSSSSPGRSTRTRLAVAALPLLALVLGLLAGPATPATARTHARSTAVLQEDAVQEAVGWLQRRVARNDLVSAPARTVKVKVDRPGRTVRWVRRTRTGPAYPGLTVDVVMALRRLDPGGPTQAAMVRALERVTRSYVTYHVGALHGRYADATARVLYVAATSGIPLHRYADGRLRRSLARMIYKEPRDPQRGRVVDSGWGGDTSNTISQAAAVQALVAVDSRHLRIAARFLAKQSCPAGHFRWRMDSPDYTCKGSNEPRNRVSSVDSTASAILALRAARAHGVRHLGDEISAASAWLARRVKPSGGVAEDDVVNARSTALAALALEATGRIGPAGNAAAWLLRHQVDQKMVKHHPALRGQRGAIAWNRAVLRRAQHDGIRRADRKLWLRSAAAGAPGLSALLPERRLGVSAVARSRRVVVRAGGLVIGERFTVKRAGRVVATGKAGALGRVRLTLRKARPGTRVEVYGNRKGRHGVTVVSKG